MTETSHDIPVTISVGDDEIEIVATVAFTIRAGRPATGPTYSSGGEPPQPAEINSGNIEITVPDPRVVGGKSVSDGQRPSIFGSCLYG